MTASFGIRRARIFDGIQFIESDSIFIQDGVIAAIGDERVIPPDAQVIDAAGQTLLPGLIDAHTHVFADFHLKQALVFGVTTELDMFIYYVRANAIKAQQAAGQGQDMADLRTAGTLATAPGGHGTQFVRRPDPVDQRPRGSRSLRTGAYR